ncbi:hypothetical protein U1839_06620 [Sphingomonas sp. RT2P30]|uniref:hypothetical protein n=1 Tax=Parasphingomonas halimpatiens TaxID=3096162 RepID=UPI002FC91A64
MSATQRPLILALSDAGLRSVLAAHLGMAGEMPVSTADHLDPALGEALRAAAILIIEETLIASAPVEWANTLRDQCWSGELVIIVDQMPALQGECDGIALVDRRSAAAIVPTLVQRWQSRRTELDTPPGA